MDTGSDHPKWPQQAGTRLGPRQSHPQLPIHASPEPASTRHRQGTHGAHDAVPESRRVRLPRAVTSLLSEMRPSVSSGTSGPRAVCSPGLQTSGGSPQPRSRQTRPLPPRAPLVPCQQSATRSPAEAPALALSLLVPSYASRSKKDEGHQRGRGGRAPPPTRPRAEAPPTSPPWPHQEGQPSRLENKQAFGGSDRNSSSVTKLWEQSKQAGVENALRPSPSPSPSRTPGLPQGRALELTSTGGRPGSLPHGEDGLLVPEAAP